MGKRSGDSRALYQECPLQVSLGGARTEERSTGWVGISGVAREEDDKEEKEDLASIYRVLAVCQGLPHVSLMTTRKRGTIQLFSFLG